MLVAVLATIEGAHTWIDHQVLRALLLPATGHLVLIVSVKFSDLAKTQILDTFFEVLPQNLLLPLSARSNSRLRHEKGTQSLI